MVVRMRRQADKANNWISRRKFCFPTKIEGRVRDWMRVVVGNNFKGESFLKEVMGYSSGVNGGAGEAMKETKNLKRDMIIRNSSRCRIWIGHNGSLPLRWRCQCRF